MPSRFGPGGSGCGFLLHHRQARLELPHQAVRPYPALRVVYTAEPSGLM